MYVIIAWHTGIDNASFNWEHAITIWHNKKEVKLQCTKFTDQVWLRYLKFLCWSWIQMSKINLLELILSTDMLKSLILGIISTMNRMNKHVSDGPTVKINYGYNSPKHTFNNNHLWHCHHQYDRRIF